ncbi:MAG: aminopeptidase [Mameliella sp.]|nr:aminopeptidase [Phaeodactylibacter sp.]
MKKWILGFAVVLFSMPAFCQYDFTVTKELACTPIKNQQRTGTCWSFSTISFLEAELMRLGKGDYDLSEMYVVRSIYKDKARNYVLRQGKANFSQGSLNHDVMRALTMAGAVPESSYSGLKEGDKYHDHSELEGALKGFLDGVLESKRPSEKWQAAFEAILDEYMGEVPAEFVHNGKSYTAETFKAALPVNPKDYVTLTSFTHHPFYETFILEIPDNYSNGQYFNVPIDELEAITAYALNNGYTVAWDGDVSEEGFSAGEGIAILPKDQRNEDKFKSPVEEIEVNQENRQKAFENFSTTDDHLMHLTGIAKDQNGTPYYITKNSWGEISSFKGFLYMSAPYFRMKTVGVMVHKDAIPSDIAKKLNL